MTKNFAANLKIGATMSSSVGRVFGALKGKIKEQEATLKGLRAAYKDAAKGTGEYAGKLDELKAKTSAAEKELKRLRSAANFDIGKGLRGVGSAFGKDLRRAGIVGGVVGGIGLGLAKNMLDTTAAFESSLTVLKTVEGSAEKAGKSFSWIQDFAQRTPFELQEVTDAFVRLRAYGIDPIRGDSLRVLGDTASAMGKDVMSAVEAIADAVTGENERLKEFGIKAAKTGSKIAYTWTDRAGKQQTKSVDANNRQQIQSTILAIWNSKYKGAMDDQSKTWSGMVSNMKDAWARFAFDVMQSGPFEKLKGKLQEFLDKLDVWKKDGTYKKWVDGVGQKLIEIGTAIWDISSGLFKTADAIQNVIGGWDKLGIVILAANFLPTAIQIGKVTRALWLMTGASWAAVGPWALVAAAIGGVFLVITSIVDPGGPLDLLGKLFPETMEKIRKSVESAVNWIGDKFDWLSQKISGFMKQLGEVTGLGGFFSGGFGGAASTGAPNYNLPQTNYGSILGVPPKGAPNPLQGIQPPAPAATKGDLIEFLKPQSNNTNNFNINVNAPGADGRRIADQLRNEFNRKPLFDSDGALVPG